MNRCFWILLCLLGISLTACDKGVDIAGQKNEEVEIYPDYKAVTVPCNIAPLNFSVVHSRDAKYKLRIAASHDTLWLNAKGADFEIPVKAWRRLLAAHMGEQLQFTVCENEGQGWEAYEEFWMLVSPDSIDNTLVYRLIPPLYGVWRHMGIYQRDLQGYKQTPIYENDAIGGNCVNCHSLRNRDAQDFLFHMRGKEGATYVCRGQEKMRIDTKIDSAISNFVYPYWHPSGDYVAFSVNKTFQVFHNSDPNRIEVIDDASDVVVYDLKRNKTIFSPLLSRADALETFPAFSPDGKKLYFCSAVIPDSLPEKYKDVKYSLLAIDFDAVTGALGTSVDTLYNAQAADALSVSFPRPAPDGKWLAATLSGYGNFSIWHKDADVWMLDLTAGEWHPLQAANSDDVESYHSWSCNSRWMVVSSRREDGLYTRPYFTHVDDDGNASKPFLLPQKYPRKYYADQMNSFNIPEFASSPISVTTDDVCEWANMSAKKVR